MSHDLLSPAELAECVGLPVATIYAYNSRGLGPRYIRVGRHVRYRRQDVEKWLNEHYSDDRGDAA